MIHYTPAQRSCWGYIGFSPSVRLSVRPASRPRVRSVVPTVQAGSISYLYILSSNFRRCVACKVSCKFLRLRFWQFCKICNFDFVLLWLEIWCESLVWVIMGRRGVSQNAGVLVVLVTYDINEWLAGNVNWCWTPPAILRGWAHETDGKLFTNEPW